MNFSSLTFSTLETIGTWDKVMERFSSFWNNENSKSAESAFEVFIHGTPYALYVNIQ